jgi:glutamine synthetase
MTNTSNLFVLNRRTLTASHAPKRSQHDIFFATLRNNFNQALVYDILRSMAAVGVDTITANAEYGPGQMEINFAPAWGVAAADHSYSNSSSHLF